MNSKDATEPRRKVAETVPSPRAVYWMRSLGNEQSQELDTGEDLLVGVEALAAWPVFRSSHGHAGARGDLASALLRQLQAGH